MEWAKMGRGWPVVHNSVYRVLKHTTNITVGVRMRKMKPTVCAHMCAMYEKDATHRVRTCFIEFLGLAQRLGPRRLHE